MQPQSIVPVLQSVAQVRNWVVANVPLTGSLLGYDLFLKLGNDVLAGLPLDTGSIATGLPYPAHEVDACLQQMAAAGLVELVAQGNATVVRPTERFLGLLDTYSKIFERLFIVRSPLRGKQLQMAVSDPEMAAFAQLVYDRVFDMGWLYLHNFGSTCFMMAALVGRIAAGHGYHARIVSCQVEIVAPNVNYKLGAPGMAKPGQIDGHAAVVLNDRMVLDFGLGNVRKNYRRDYPWGVAMDYRRDGHVFGAIVTRDNEQATWRDDWQSPGTETELAAAMPLAESLFTLYAQRFLER